MRDETRDTDMECASFLVNGDHVVDCVAPSKAGRVGMLRSTSISLANECAVDCIDHIEQSKKSGRPLSLSLRPNFELLTQLKSLHILFLDEDGEKLPRVVPEKDRCSANSSIQTRRSFSVFYVTASVSKADEALYLDMI